DQLAGVLGHESAHVVERHSVKAIERAMTYQLLSDLVLRNSGTAVQSAAGIAVQLAVELPHSRSDENQADSVGMKLAYNAGFSPYGLPNFLKTLNQISPSRSPSWLSDHPSTPDRITKTEQEAAQLANERRPVPISLLEKEEAPAEPVKGTAALTQ
ncbi:MAG TPA: M48 family metalloprotease, partial [Armatimonadota bacterium]